MINRSISESNFLSNKLKISWRWLLIFGILSIVAGFVAMSTPLFMTYAIGVILGVLLFINGIFEFANAFSYKGFVRVVGHIFLALLYLFCGVSILAAPLQSMVSLTFFISLLLIASGVAKAVISISEHKTNPNWSLLLFNGTINILLGLMLLNDWPASGLWALGLFLGIDLMFSGVTTTFIAYALRRAEKRNSAQIPR